MNAWTLARHLSLAWIVLLTSRSELGACLNDSYARETWAPGTGAVNEALRRAVFHSAPMPTKAELEAKLAKLEANPRKLGPSWWTEMAGTLIRLGQLDRATVMLEEAVKKFPKDYPVRSSLGTAYHLAGRLQEAEREIGEGLKINPNGHGGREIYHLALLQYLNAPKEWQAEHLLLDEWTPVFHAMHKQGTFEDSLVEKDKRSDGSVPAYLTQRVLAVSPHQEVGVGYMMTLNPKEAACFVMAGVLATKAKDWTIAKKAFERALSLGTPQAEAVQAWIAFIDAAPREPARHIRAVTYRGAMMGFEAVFVLSLAFGLFILWWLYKNLVSA